MNEIDELEDIYFGRKEISDEKERAKLTGLFKYCWNLKPPEKPSVHIPYNLLVYLAKVAPKGREYEFIIQKLKDYRYLARDQEPTQDLLKRIEYALNWARDYAEEIKEEEVKLSEKEKKAIKRLIEVLKTEGTAEKIQNAIFQIARENGIKTAEFFKTLYMILLGTPRGPRLGPYIVAMGRENVIKSLRRALEKG